MPNKTVLITGSSRGIGKAIAEKFSINGFNVVLNCKSSSDKLKALKERLLKSNPNIIAFENDISNYITTKEMFTKITDIFGGIDILINNAGISYVGLFNEMTPNEWDNIMNINVNGMYNCTHLALPYMIHQKQGVIINISSIWGNTGASCEAVYSASKGAVNSFTKALAKELGPCGIKINAIACGAIETEMNGFLSAEEKSALVEEIPVMRFGKPEEVASLAYFLASESSNYLTGQILTLDGAWT